MSGDQHDQGFMPVGSGIANDTIAGMRRNSDDVLKELATAFEDARSRDDDDALLVYCRIGFGYARIAFRSLDRGQSPSAIQRIIDAMAAVTPRLADVLAPASGKDVLRDGMNATARLFDVLATPAMDGAAALSNDQLGEWHDRFALLACEIERAECLRSIAARRARGAIEAVPDQMH